MGHVLLLTLWLSYQAFSNGLLLGVIPSDVPDDFSVSSHYDIADNYEDDDPYTIDKRLDLVSPVIESEAAVAVDLESDKVLFSKNVYKKRQIASITKLMTALITIENIDLDQTFTVSRKAASVIGSSMNLYEGEKMKVRDLLYGALIQSANDAAYTLAEGVSGSEEEFVKLMNDKAKSLGLVNTNFDNSIGMDSKNNYSTAFEVYIIFKEFLKNPILKEIISLPEFTVVSEQGNKHILKNTNKNLGSFLNVIGGKTGTTDMAGESLVNIIKLNDEHEIVIILLDSPRRFSEAKILGEWVSRAYEWTKVSENY